MLQKIGLCVVLFALYKIGVWVYRTFVVKKGYEKYIAPNKSWAIVTGSTAGVGYGFASELARLKSNLLLISRSEEKLDKQCEILAKEHNIKAEFVVLDFEKKEYAEELKQVEEKLKGKQITILVNNVGINYPDNCPELFLNLKKEDVEKINHVNLDSMLNMNRTVIPLMMNNSGSNKGLIINLASFTNDFRTPLLAIYAATKGYIDVFSQTLNYEYADQGIKSIAIKPMYVASQMSGYKKSSFSVCSGAELAKATLNNIGGLFAPISFSPYWVHEVMMYAISLLPEKFFMAQQKQQMEGVRKRKHQKRAAAKEGIPAEK